MTKLLKMSAKAYYELIKPGNIRNTTTAGLLASQATI